MSCRKWLNEGGVQLKQIEDALGCNHGILLGVGCGVGHVIKAALEKGYDSVGLDVEKRLLFDVPFVLGVTEYLPFKNDVFDAVSCISTLEHVQSVEQSCRELMRVLKRGGKIYVYAPNFMFPYEHHYKVPFIPLPKPLARLYLKLIQPFWRDVETIETIEELNYVTFWMLKTFFKCLGGNVANLTYQRFRHRKNKFKVILAKLGLDQGIYLVVEKRC